MDGTVEIQLSHRSLIRPRMLELGLGLSEYTFANIYLFRHVHHYELAYIEDRIFIFGISYDGKKYLMPLYDITVEDSDFLGRCLAQVDMFFPLPEAWASVLEAKGLAITYKDEDSDYVFSAETIQTYAGRHLAGRRNLTVQFKDHFEAKYQHITRDVKNEALMMVSTWDDQAKIKQPQEVQACREAIENIEELNLCGMLFSVDKMAVGLIIGEPLVDRGTDKVFVLHFAKGDTRYKGIYQYMYQEYAKSCNGYRFLNWEQDLGDLGLQKAKKAYFPHHLAKKMRATKAT